MSFSPWNFAVASLRGVDFLDNCYWDWLTSWRWRTWARRPGSVQALFFVYDLYLIGRSILLSQAVCFCARLLAIARLIIDFLDSSMGDNWRYSS
jgi:hypothetical protein